MSGYWYPPNDEAERMLTPEPRLTECELSDAELRAEAVRKIAEEVSRKPMPPLPTRRMGFL